MTLGVGNAPTGEEALPSSSGEEVCGGGGCSGDRGGNPDPCRTNCRSSRKSKVPCPTVGSRRDCSATSFSSLWWVVVAANKKAEAVDDNDALLAAVVVWGSGLVEVGVLDDRAVGARILRDRWLWQSLQWLQWLLWSLSQSSGRWDGAFSE